MRVSDSSVRLAQFVRTGLNKGSGQESQRGCVQLISWVTWPVCSCRFTQTTLSVQLEGKQVTSCRISSARQQFVIKELHPDSVHPSTQLSTPPGVQHFSNSGVRRRWGGGGGVRRDCRSGLRESVFLPVGLSAPEPTDVRQVVCL